MTHSKSDSVTRPVDLGEILSGLPAPITSNDPRVGTILGKYQLVRRLGKGGMGEVYEARDTVLQRAVAIKLLPESVGRNSELLKRFLVEARAAARLNHPNVVVVYEVDKRDDLHFIAMELVRGNSAEDLLRSSGPFPWGEATRVIADACRGLAAAHDAGVIHRDIKPANLMLSHEGLVKLADFGLAKAADDSGLALTTPGSVVGTPLYMSPEQCRSQILDPRSDIYSLGGTYYALLAGKPPFVAEGPVQVMFAHCTDPIPDPRDLQPTIPDSCAAIVCRAMAKDPKDRFSSAKEMLAALEAIPSPSTAADLQRKAAKHEFLQPAAETSTMNPLGVRSEDARGGPVNAGNSQTFVEPSPRKSRRKLLAFAVLCLLVWVSVGSLYLKWRDRAGVPQNQNKKAGSKQEGDGAPLAKVPGDRHTLLEDVPEDGLALPMGGTVEAVAFSADGKKLAAGVADQRGGVRLWDLNGEHEPSDLWGGLLIRALAFSPDGLTLAATTRGSVRLRSLPDGKDWELPIPGAQVRALAFSPNGKLLAVGCNFPEMNKASILVWNLTERRRLHSLEGHTESFGGLAFSPDGSVLASGGKDGVVKLWHTDTGKKWHQDLNAGSGVNFLTFSPKSNLPVNPSGRWLGVATDQGLQFWNATRWVKDFDTQTWGIGWDLGSVLCVTYSSDGKYWAAGTSRGEIRMRDNIASGIHRFGDSREGVHAIAFSPDGKFLAAGSADNTVKVWDVTKSRPQ